MYRAFVLIFLFASVACSGRTTAAADGGGSDDGSQPAPHDGPPSPYSAEAGSDAPPEADVCTTGYLGDTAAPIAFEIAILGDSPNEVLVSDGDMAPMLVPQQAGRVMLVGVRATNLDGCAVTLNAALRDTPTGQVRLDGRTVNLRPRGDGWGTSGEPDGGAGNQADYANVPTCANEWSSRDVFGQLYELEVTLTDRLGKKATRTIHVTPVCAGFDPSWQPCACICRAGYRLGQACTDGGH